MQSFKDYITENKGVDESKADALVAEFQSIVKANQDIWIDEQKNTTGSGPKSWWVVRYNNAQTGDVDNNRIFLFDPKDKNAAYKSWQDAMKAYLVGGRHRSITVFTGMPDPLSKFIRKAQKQ